MRIWLKSKHFDAADYFRFGSKYPEHDGASWPLGIALDPDARRLVVDPGFDQFARAAWWLPWQYSKARIQMADALHQANFVMRHVGHLNGERNRFDALMSPLGKVLAEHRSDQPRTFAMTPFCILVQHSSRGECNEIQHTELLFFYTFESFLQEGLAFQALKTGASSSQIAHAYRHVYSNCSVRPEVIPGDPARFPLARLASASYDWDEIRLVAERANLGIWRVGNPAHTGRARRRRLFHYRLQAHLMVAVAVACRGLDTFAVRPTPLCQLMAGPPNVDELAAVWLRPALCAYDYPAECEAVLTSLALHYGTALAPAERGADTPGGALVSTPAEQAIATATSSLPLSRDQPEVFERPHWALFGLSFDDDSVEQWHRTHQGA